MKTFTKSVLSWSFVSVTLMGCLSPFQPATAETTMVNKSTSMTKSGPVLNDLEIAHIAYTAGNIDIRYAHLALALSDDPEVRNFAELMIRDHSAINTKALALVKKLRITPQDNAMSQHLLEQSVKLRGELSQLRGEAFAKRYAANELGYHQTVNSVVEKIFLPQAQNPELKALLTAALQTFKVHEGHAETMQKTVMSQP
jgi:putative membrane protein